MFVLPFAEDVHWYNLIARSCSGIQGCVVGQSEIAAEPVNDNGHLKSNEAPLDAVAFRVVQLSECVPAEDGYTPRMARFASWIRESDDADFQGFFRRHPEIQVCDARRSPVDLEQMDGLLITGGPDISLEFHQVPIATPELIFDAEPERDAWEFSALKQAIERGIPILCVCKGLQVLNVALGGTLLLDIRGHDLPELKRQNIQPLRYAGGVRHRFDLVNSSHHQAIDRLAPGLEVQAWSTADGIIEQVQLANYPWALGVQYHPERDPSYAPLIEDFLQRVQDHAAAHALRHA